MPMVLFPARTDSDGARPLRTGAAAGDSGPPSPNRPGRRRVVLLHTPSTRQSRVPALVATPTSHVAALTSLARAGRAGGADVLKSIKIFFAVPRPFYLGNGVNSWPRRSEGA